MAKETHDVVPLVTKTHSNLFHFWGAALQLLVTCSLPLFLFPQSHVPLWLKDMIFSTTCSSASAFLRPRCFWGCSASSHRCRAHCHIEKMLFAVVTLARRSRPLIWREILVGRGLEREMPALGNLPNHGLLGTVSIVAIQLCHSLSFQNIFHSCHSYRSRKAGTYSQNHKQNDLPSLLPL